MLTASFYSVLSFTARGLRRLASKQTTNLRNRAALKQMAELDDHTLADIGLTRGDLARAKSQSMLKDPLLIDPFDARRRLHSSELDILSRWPRPLPNRPYVTHGPSYQATPSECS